MPKVSEDSLIHDVEARLIHSYPSVPPADVVAVVADARQSFARSKIRDFVPVLVERRARRHLVDRVHSTPLAS